jgi:hypothetical protein
MGAFAVINKIKVMLLVIFVAFFFVIFIKFHNSFDNSLYSFLSNTCNVKDFIVVESKSNGIFDGEKEWEIKFNELQDLKIKSCIKTNFSSADKYDFEFYKNKFELSFGKNINEKSYEIFVADLAIKNDPLCELNSCNAVVLISVNSDVSFWGIYKN